MNQSQSSCVRWLTLFAVAASSSHTGSLLAQTAPPSEPPAQPLKATLTRMEHAFTVAPAIRYDAILQIANDDLKPPMKSFAIHCVAQKPNLQRQEISQNGKMIGIITYDGYGGIYCDLVRKRYIKLPVMTSPDDVGKIHANLDKVTGSGDAGNFFDSSLVNKPMLDLAGQYNRDSDVQYTSAKSVVKGHEIATISQTTTGNGSNIYEDVTLDAAQHLLGYTLFTDVVGQKTKILDEQFTRLELLTHPLPASTYAYRPPADAKPF